LKEQTISLPSRAFCLSCLFHKLDWSVEPFFFKCQLSRYFYKMAGFSSHAPKTKNLVVAGSLSAFVFGVYFNTMRAVGRTNELQTAIDKFEQQKSKQESEATIPSKPWPCVIMWSETREWLICECAVSTFDFALSLYLIGMIMKTWESNNNLNSHVSGHFLGKYLSTWYK